MKSGEESKFKSPLHESGQDLATEVRKSGRGQLEPGMNAEDDDIVAQMTLEMQDGARDVNPMDLRQATREASRAKPRNKLQLQNKLAKKKKTVKGNMGLAVQHQEIADAVQLQGLAPTASEEDIFAEDDLKPVN